MLQEWISIKEREGLVQTFSMKPPAILGEGAWHKVYQCETVEGPIVIRVPKKIAYEKEVEYNEEALLAEYEGNGWFYKKANEIQPGICPSFYRYFVSKELTYTIESFAGTPLKVSQEDEKQMYGYGVLFGEFYRQLDQIWPERPGFGYLSWDGKKASGQMNSDPITFMKEEKEEYRKELEVLLGSELSFDKASLRTWLNERLDHRNIEKYGISLGNQDTSPENIVIHEGMPRIIDPLPILYSGVSMAGNFIHNYEFTFPLYTNAPRYSKHRFDHYIPQLKAMALGFEEGYCAGSQERKEDLYTERLIHHLTMIHHHYQVLQSEEKLKSMAIRMGSSKAIKERMMILLKNLEERRNVRI